MVLSKKLILLTIALMTFNTACSEKKSYVIVSGGQDSGGGNTSFSTESDIALATSFIQSNFVKILDSLSKQDDAVELVGLHINDLKKLTLSIDESCKDTREIVCVPIDFFKKTPKDFISEEVFIWVIGRYLSFLGEDQLAVSMEQLKIRSKLELIFESLFVLPLLSKIKKEVLLMIESPLKKLSMQVSQQANAEELCKTLGAIRRNLHALYDEARFTLIKYDIKTLDARFNIISRYEYENSISCSIRGDVEIENVKKYHAELWSLLEEIRLYDVK